MSGVAANENSVLDINKMNRWDKFGRQSGNGHRMKSMHAFQSCLKGRGFRASVIRLVFSIHVVCSAYLSIRVSAQTAANSAFGVTGRVEYRFYDDGKVVDSETNAFEFLTDGSVFVIRTFPPSNETGLKVEYYEYTSDSTISFLVTKFAPLAANTNLFDKSKLIRLPDGRPGVNTGKGTVSAINEAFADIRPDSMPPNHIGFVFMPWLAYAPDKVFSLDGRKVKLPPFGFVGPSWPGYQGHKVEMRWTKSDYSRLNPQVLFEYADGELFLFTQEQRKQFGLPMLPTSYEQGYTNATYQVLSWTNIVDLLIPLHFRYTKFIPRLNSSNSNDLDIQLTYDGLANGFKLGVETLSLPWKLPNWTRVTEYRFSASQAQPHTYVAENGQILTRSEIEAREKQLNISVAARSGQIRRIILIILALCTFPLVLIYLRRYRTSGI